MAINPVVRGNNVGLPFRQAYFATRAASLLGSNPASLCFGFNDFDGTESDTWQHFSSGGSVLPAAAAPGCIEITTSAVASTTASAAVAGHPSATTYHRFPAGATARLYGAARCKIVSAIDANCSLVPWTSNLGNLSMGYDGSRSANWHFYSSGGGVVDSGIAAATGSWVTLEFIQDGSGGVTFIVNEAVSVTGTASAPSVYGLSVFASNGATAAIRNMYIDFVAVGFPRQE